MHAYLFINSSSTVAATSSRSQSTQMTDTKMKAAHGEKTDHTAETLSGGDKTAEEVSGSDGFCAYSIVVRTAR